MNEPRPVDPVSVPFKYLDHFQEADHGLFAGREDEIQEVLTGVSRGRTFVLYGAPGVGKTSLLLAGLFPRWRQRGFHPVRVRVLESPVEELCAVLASELACPALAKDQEPAALVPCTTRAPLLVVLDHFEDFFLRYKDRPQEREAFIAFLGRVYRESAANVRLVFNLNEDAYAQLEELRAELPDLTQNGLRLLPLTAYGVRQAIIRPLSKVGAHADEAFVNALVDQLEGWHYEPFALQICCAELYREVAARRGLPVRLTREDLERMGNVEGIVGEYFRRMGRDFARDRLLLVGAVLEGLISPEHTRRAIRARDVLAGPVRATLEEIQEELQRFADRRVVRVVQRRDGPWYELMHERLVGVLEPQLNTDPEYLRFRTTRNLISTLCEDPQWREASRWLLSREQLDERVEPLKERLRLDGRQTEFLLRSSIHARKEEAVAYWASRYDAGGPGRAAQLVLGLLEHPDPDVRLGAVLASARLEDGTGRLTGRCLRLALGSPDAELRRAAGRAFTRLVRPEDAVTLRRALGIPEQRAPALEVMADLCEAGRSLREFPVRERFLAQLIFRRRRVELNRRSIQQRANIGALTGAWMTAVWVFTIGLVLLFVLVLTTFPQLVTVLRWSQELIGQGLGLLLFAGISMLVPLGALLGWRVARRTGILIALHGHEHWGYPTGRSGTVMFSSMLLSGVVLVLIRRTDAMEGLVQKLHQPAWVLMLLMALASTFLAWVMTWMLVALGSRCISRRARNPVIFFWAFLGSGGVPLAAEMFLARSSLWAGSWDVNVAGVLSTIAGIAAFIASFQSFVVISALAMARKRLGGVEPSPRRLFIHLSRAALLVVAAGVLVGAAFIWGPDTLPYKKKVPLFEDASLDGDVWKVRDSDYFTILGPGGESFAMSVHGEDVRTRLLLNGVDSTDELLVVSAHPQVFAAVSARTRPVPREEAPPAPPGPRLRYHYELVQEPILSQVPQQLSRNHWTLVSLPLDVLPPTPGGRPQWQASMAATLPAGWKSEGTEVLVHPVLLHLPTVAKGACLGIFGSSDTARGFTNALVMRNKDDAEPVPPPNSEAELFLGGFRLPPGARGDWSLVMTVSPPAGAAHEECGGPDGLIRLMESRRPLNEDAYSPAWMVVAVKMY